MFVPAPALGKHQVALPEFARAVLADLSTVVVSGELALPLSGSSAWILDRVQFLDRLAQSWSQSTPMQSSLRS